MSPAKNNTKRPQSVIDEAVKRFLAGENAGVLAKYYKVSKPGFYQWVAKYKKALLENSDREGLSPTQMERLDKQTLIAENQSLKLENTKLRNKVVSLMIKAGEM